MPKEILELVNDINKNHEELKKSLKERFDEMATKGHVEACLETKTQQINDAMTRADEAIEAAEKAQAMAKARRMMADEAEEGLKAGKFKSAPELRKAFSEFIRKGEEGLSAKENEMMQMHTKSMSSGSDTAGGYVVMPEMDNNITRILYETSPMRQLAEVKQISSDQMERLQRVDLAGSKWSDRDGADSESTAPTWKKISIKAWKQEAEPMISQDLIDDAFIDIEAELTLALSTQFEITENTAFMSGNGVGQPMGILSYPAGSWNHSTPNSPTWGTIEQIVSGDASNLTYAGIISLVYSLKDGYLSRARFMANRLTVGKLRLLVDGIGQALWTPGFGSEPATFMGYPIVRAADMPVVASNALALAFGDFSRGYMIVDRIGTRILRDPYTSKPFVKYYTTKRTGGGVTNFEAIKLQKIST